ncbi:hypothetical protein [Chitinimonas sp. BJB300]|uniref:hypothetical protein n=1 Tax=Chitinimonas sp. BJB300 TaxID=1559339 RepID=UPI000C1152D8|nr:hypothetical protein [Chitinimonas sp. BJB300]PHV10688.1 hypothetical protein CSQ89_14875 [Chitinimonas sp. BJB300]TSJ90768.1 hypothetical protein FG002_000125 [Chitinimonas sp. BJB300]
MNERPTTASPLPTLTPADIARIALKRLAELGLAPIPENYAKFYNAIAAIKSPTDKTEEELKSAYQVLFKVSDVLDGMTGTSGSLLEDLVRGGEVMSRSRDTLKVKRNQAFVEATLNDLIESTDTVCQSVSASHRDLHDLMAAVAKNPV